MSLRQLLACSVLVSLVACDGSNGDSGDRAATILDLEGDPAAGEQVYADECSSCHGVSGEGGVGPAMSSVAGEGEADALRAASDHRRGLHAREGLQSGIVALPAPSSPGVEDGTHAARLLLRGLRAASACGCVPKRAAKSARI